MKFKPKSRYISNDLFEAEQGSILNKHNSRLTRRMQKHKYRIGHRAAVDLNREKNLNKARNARSPFKEQSTDTQRPEPRKQMGFQASYPYPIWIPHLESYLFL